MGVALYQPPVLVAQGLCAVYQHLAHMAGRGPCGHLHRTAGPVLAVHLHHLHPGTEHKAGDCCTLGTPDHHVPTSTPEAEQPQEQLTWGRLVSRGSSPLALEGPPRMGLCGVGLQSSGKGLGMEGSEAALRSSSGSFLGRRRGLYQPTPTPSPSQLLTPSSVTPRHLLAGMGRGWDLVASPGRGVSGGGGVLGGAPGSGHRSSGGLPACGGDRSGSMTSGKEEEVPHPGKHRPTQLPWCPKSCPCTPLLFLCNNGD